MRTLVLLTARGFLSLPALAKGQGVKGNLPDGDTSSGDRKKEKLP